MVEVLSCLLTHPMKMEDKISAAEVAELLDNHKEVLESYVLLHEMKVYLKIGHDYYHPEVVIKIYLCNSIPRNIYHFEVSHLVHAPGQAAAYSTSNTSASTVEQAIELAISSTTRFFKVAISNGHVPDDSWLVPNTRF
jgi:hypothetical protein